MREDQTQLCHNEGRSDNSFTVRENQTQFCHNEGKSDTALSQWGKITSYTVLLRHERSHFHYYGQDQTVMNIWRRSNTARKDQYGMQDHIQFCYGMQNSHFHYYGRTKWLWTLGEGNRQFCLGGGSGTFLRRITGEALLQRWSFRHTSATKKHNRRKPRKKSLESTYTTHWKLEKSGW